eukprot:Polyplicarium_translucidae@DN3324_c1_g1_i9.p1
MFTLPWQHEPNLGHHIIGDTTHIHQCSGAFRWQSSFPLGHSFCFTQWDAVNEPSASDRGGTTSVPSAPPPPDQDRFLRHFPDVDETAVEEFQRAMKSTTKKEVLEDVAARALHDIGCPGESLPIWMWDEQKRLLKEMVQLALAERVPGRGLTYLEFGAGGSTTLLPPFFDRGFSYEHADQWCGKLKEQPVVKCMSDLGRLSLRCISGPVHQRGQMFNPIRTSGREFVQYYDPFESLARDDNATYFNFVLIDGRFRGIVAMNLLPYIDEKSIVMLHDFQDYYHEIESYYEVRRTATDGPSVLGWLTRRPGKDLEERARQKVHNLTTTNFEESRI